MKLLPKASTKKQKPVVDWPSIKKDATAMLERLNAGGFPGRWQDGLALNHCQVSESPFHFFVVHKSWGDMLPSVICNLRILEKYQPETFKEACLSYPHRDVIKTKRYWRVVVEYETPSALRGFFGNGLKTEQMAFEGIAAFMFQHEDDHAKGIDIYHKGK